MSQHQPIRIATVGLGHYAGLICNLLIEQTDRPDAPVQLTAVCEIDQQPHAAKIEALKARGIAVYSDFAELLATDIDAVWLPLPIPLHAPFTTQALEAGKAVMSEKPAAATVDEVDAMIAARDRTGRPVAIGFQEMYDPTTLKLKRLLLDGQIGKVHRITHHAAGARGDTYYNRSAWAGELSQNGQWVLDGPATNAHAHAVNLLHYFAGPTESASATPLAIEAELYRSNPITSYDTSALRITLDGGIEAVSLLTHACEYFVDDTLVIEGDRGRVIKVRDVTVIESPAGTQVWRRQGDFRQAMVERFARLVRGESDNDRSYASLENARMQVLIVNGAVQATPIYDIPDSAGTRMVNTTQGRARAVRGMESLLTLCARRGVLLHESQLFDWTRPAGKLDLRGYSHFAGPAGAPTAAPTGKA